MTSEEGGGRGGTARRCTVLDIQESPCLCCMNQDPDGSCTPDVMAFDDCVISDDTCDVCTSEHRVCVPRGGMTKGSLCDTSAILIEYPHHGAYGMICLSHARPRHTRSGSLHGSPRVSS